MEWFSVPEHCLWSLYEVYIPQRCAKGTCNPANRKDIVKEVAVAYGAQAKSMAEKFDMPKLHEWPTTRPRIVDIGAGLAMYHVNIHRFFENRTEHIIMDRTANLTHGFRSNGGFHRSSIDGGRFPFYSSLECARDIALANGFPNPSNFQTIHADQGALVRTLAAGSVDLVMSILSWGFHYPISTYANDVKTVLKPISGRLLVHPQKSTQGARTPQDMRQYFTCSNSSAFCCVGCKDPGRPPNHPDNRA